MVLSIDHVSLIASILGLAFTRQKVLNNSCTSGKQSDDSLFRSFTMSEKPETSPHTCFFDQLCNILLSKSPQKPMDQWLVALVRIERLTQSIVLMKTSREMRGQSGVPLDVVVAGFQKQIDNLIESLSAELMLDRMFSESHFFSATSFGRKTNRNEKSRIFTRPHVSNENDAL